jgi:signal transduction histidine kinase
MRGRVDTPVPRSARLNRAIRRGSEQGVILANPKFEELVGRTNLVGHRGREAIPGQAAGATWDILERVRSTGEPFLGNEYPGLWGLRGSSERFFNFVAQPTKGASGEMANVMVHAVEVTDSVTARRKTEALARQLVATDRSKDEFPAILGYELRNPLAPILTALHLMRLRSTDPSTARGNRTESACSFIRCIASASAIRVRGVVK